MYIELDDFRQSYVVAKNEIRKFIRGKRFMAYVILIALIFALITIFPYLLGGNIGETPGDVVASYVSAMPFMIVLAATLFASVVIVSEFEERTALILFTRPLKKTSIFVGKVLGCILLETVMIVLFYAGIVLVSLIAEGGVSSGLLVSLGMAFLYTVAASGVAVFISSVMKKGVLSAILVFFLLLMILPLISGLISASIDPWFMINQSSDAISTCIPAYVDRMNEQLQNLIDRWGLPPEMFENMMITAPDMAKAVGTMVGWSIVSMVLAWIAFIRREF